MRETPWKNCAEQYVECEKPMRIPYHDCDHTVYFDMCDMKRTKEGDNYVFAQIPYESVVVFFSAKCQSDAVKVPPYRPHPDWDKQTF